LSRRIVNKKNIFIAFGAAMFVIALFFVIQWKSIETKTEADGSANIDQLSKAAEQGDVEAQYKLARQYKYGNGVPKDVRKACALYKTLAEQGMNKAQNTLGICYETGRGIEQNIERAIHWYEKAAEAGDVHATSNLAALYHEQEQYSEALKWYEKTADLGDIRAMSILGYMYEYGLGTPVNLSKSVAFYTQAAEQGDATAQFNLGRYYMSERGGQNYNEAMRWYMKSAGQGMPDAHYNIAIMHDKGWATPPDMKLAGYHYKQALAGDYKTHQIEDYLKDVKAVCLRLQAPTPEQVESCFIAAGAGNGDAQRMLSLFYFHGQGVKKDHVESLAWALVDPSSLRGREEEEFITRFSSVKAYLLLDLSKEDIEAAALRGKEYRTRYR